MRRAGCAVLLLLVANGGCRDAPALFDSAELPPLGPAPYQLTFSTNEDHSPAWIGDRDSLLYLSEDPDFDIDVLHVIHREGGVASRVFPELQGGTISVPIEIAAPDPTGRRIAMLSLLSNNPLELCGPTMPACSPSGDGVLIPPSRLDSALIRVRRIGASSPLGLDPSVAVQFDGRFFDRSDAMPGFDGVWVIDLHPFQRLFNETGRAPTRPSWAPDGDRLVLSDGLFLFTWEVGSSDLVPVPGTIEGIRPAWSPDGQWIAFERLLRGDEFQTFCEHRDGPNPVNLVCFEQRTQWTIDAHTIVITEPGTAMTWDLALGSNPTWSPDGLRVYYEGLGGIRSVAIDGSDDRAVPDTEGGLDPAVSPDGRWLAFSRGGDIWIVELEP